jgi:hypothetical protein
MYRCITKIKITQIPTTDWPLRKTVLNFDFVNEFETTNSWRDLTNKGHIILPKNIYFRDETGTLKPLKGTNINVGGFSSSAPLFLRGDKVTIEAGYKYFNAAHVEIEDTTQFLDGYITKVGSKIPIVLEVEDNMFLLKKQQVGTKTFSKTDTLEDIMNFIVQGTDFTVSSLTKTIFGNPFIVGNETATQVLQRLQKLYGFDFYFRGKELRGGALIYIEAEADNEIFHFQKNIISDELEYARKDDIKLSAKAYNTITTNDGLCKDGSPKTKRKRLEVLVTMKTNPAVGEIEYLYRTIERGESVSNIDGIQLDFKFPDANDVATLAFMTYVKLKQYYFDGFRGHFTTFGIPALKTGDNAILQDNILPERNGSYKIKSVTMTGGVNGMRQVVELDYKNKI